MAYGKRVSWSVRRPQVERLVARHQREGRSWKQLALEAGLALPTLYGWVHRLQREQGSRGRERVGARRCPARFLEVTPTESPGRSPDIEGGVVIELAGGHRIRVASSFEEETLRRVVAVLARC